MVSNQVLGARLAAGLLIVSIAVCGCSHLRRTQAPASAPAPVTQAAGEARAVPAEPEMTATEAAISAAGAGAAAAPGPVRLRQNPDDAVSREQRREGWQREFRRAGKGDAQHYQPVGLADPKPWQ